MGAVQGFGLITSVLDLSVCAVSLGIHRDISATSSLCRVDWVLLVFTHLSHFPNHVTGILKVCLICEWEYLTSLDLHSRPSSTELCLQSYFYMLF